MSTHKSCVESTFTTQSAGDARLAARPLEIEQTGEPAGQHVVIAVVAPTRSADLSVVHEELLPVLAGELTALVRVTQYGRFGLASAERHDQLAQHEDPHHGQVRPALVRLGVGDIGHPGLAGCGGPVNGCRPPN